MRASRLAELEAYYSQNDDLYESHGAVLELIYEVKRLQEVVKAADLFWAQHAYEHDDATSDRLAHALTAYDEAVGS